LTTFDDLKITEGDAYNEMGGDYDEEGLDETPIEDLFSFENSLDLTNYLVSFKFNFPWLLKVCWVLAFCIVGWLDTYDFVMSHYYYFFATYSFGKASGELIGLVDYVFGLSIIIPRKPWNRYDPF